MSKGINTSSFDESLKKAERALRKFGIAIKQEETRKKLHKHICKIFDSSEKHKHITR